MTNEKNVNVEGYELMEVRENTVPTDIESLKTDGAGASFYCSIVDNGTRESKIAIYNAVNSADNKLDDFKGKKINVVDIVAHPVHLITDDGEEIDCLRIVLIDDKGVSYETVATGILSSLQKLFPIVGKPSYNPPLTVIPTERKTRKGFKVLTLDLAR